MTSTGGSRGGSFGALRLGTMTVLAVIGAVAVALESARSQKKRPLPPPCPGGRFVVPATEPLLPIEATGIPADGVSIGVVDGRYEAAIDGGCDAVPAKVKPKRKGHTVVRARWKTCGELRKVRLNGRIDASCTMLTGVVRGKRMKRQRFVAPLATAGSPCPFAITSPVDGSLVSGAIYFGIQLQQPVPLDEVELRVAGEVVTHQFPGETPLRVFVIPRDHPEGELALSARVGAGDAACTQAVRVQVVHEPPSSATVGPAGALLGDVEQNGAVSTVVIPPGVAAGANVTFQTMTQAEVLAATGVDYDTLGVTFLGAQEIRSTVPTGDGVNMTSGGFGPMVQPNQMVVSYRIAPDMGRGVDELMVINEAAIAPNGDVVSNTPSVALAGAGMAESALGTAALAAPYTRHTAATTTLPAAPPGAVLEFDVRGLNVYAVDGHYVRFRVGTQVVDHLATVGLGPTGQQYLLVTVPELPAGTATVELVQVAGDVVFGTYTMTIAPSLPLGGQAPKAIVDGALAGLLDVLDETDAAFRELDVDLDFGPVKATIVDERARWAARPAGDPELTALATLLNNAGVGPATTAALRRVTQPLDQSGSRLCLLNAGKFLKDKEFLGRAFQGDYMETGIRTAGSSLTLDYLDRFADRLEGSEYDCDPLRNELCEAGIGPGCGDDEVIEPPDDDDPRPQPRPRPRPDRDRDPLDWITGMGSIQPPGGPLGGHARPRRGGGGAALRTPGGPVTAASTHIPRLPTGRYTVRAIRSGVPWPFAAWIGEDGYFFLPAIAGGQTTQLVVTDQADLSECVLDVQGRSLRSATVVSLDLDECLSDPIDPGEYSIVWTGMGVGSNWTTAANWDPPRVPDADDDVLIPSSADSVLLHTASVAVRNLRSRGAVTLNGTTLTVANDLELNWLHLTGSASTFTAGGTTTIERLRVQRAFTLPSEFATLKHVVLAQGGNLAVDHELTVTERLEINHGWLTGNGRTIVSPGAKADVLNSLGGAGGGVVAGGATLEIRGTFEWLAAQTRLQIRDDALIHVAPGGTLHMGYAGGDIEGGGPSAGTNHVRNEGLFLVDSGATSTIRADLDNFGTIRIDAGSTLTSNLSYKRLRNEGVITGDGTLFSDRFVGGSQPFVHAAGAILDVPTLRLGILPDGTSTVIEGQLGIKELEIQNGLLVLDQDLDLDRLVLHYGATQGSTLQSSGTTTVRELLSVGQGTFAGTGTTVLEPGGVLEMLLSRNRVVTDSHVLVNHGTATWGPMSGAQQITVNADAELRNHGEFIVENDRPIGGAGTFRNFGTVRKRVATGTSTWTVCFVEEPGSQVIEESGSIDAGC
jgi:hypothetical protein